MKTAAPKRIPIARLTELNNISSILNKNNWFLLKLYFEYVLWSFPDSITKQLMSDINYEANIKACVFELIVYKTYMHTWKLFWIC